jgi:uncharacterized protein
LAGILELPSDSPVGSILFSHCFTCSKDLKAIVRISRKLAELGWAVLRYDFRGLGQSEGDFADSSFSTNLIDLESATKYMASLAIPVDFLMGHSFGGAASLAMAEKIASAKGVIALAAPSDTRHLANLLESMDSNIVSSGEGEVMIGGFRYRVRQTMTDDFRQHDLPSLVNVMQKPLLALHSRTDTTVPYWHAIKNCDFRLETHGRYPRSLVTLPDCNHLMVEEGIPLVVARIVDSWCLSILWENRADEH